MNVEILVGRELVGYPSTYLIFRDVLLGLRELGGLSVLLPLVEAFERACAEEDISRFWLWLSEQEKIYWMKEKQLAVGDGDVWNRLLDDLRERLRVLRMKDLGNLLSQLDSERPADLSILRSSFVTLAKELSSVLPRALEFKTLTEKVISTISAEGIVSGDFGSLIGGENNPLKGKTPIVTKELSVISGRTGRGKTTVALNIIYKYLIEGKRVVHISTEMPAESVLSRLCSIHSNRPTELYLFRRDVKTFQSDLKSLMEVVEGAGGKYAFLHAPLIYYADVDICVRTKAEEWGGVDLLVIDYIQQIQTNDGSVRDESRALQLRRIVQSLHHLSSEVKMATIVLSQLNDKGDVKDSRSIEEEASLNIRLGMWTLETFIGRMWRAAGLKDDTPLTPQIREIFKEIYRTHLDIEVKKNRYGENLSGWHFFVVWDGSTGRTENIVEWTNVVRNISQQLRSSVGKEREERPSEPEVKPDELVKSFYDDLGDETEEEEFPF